VSERFACRVNGQNRTTRRHRRRPLRLRIPVLGFPWTFDTSVPFQWQPANPLVGVFGNVFIFFAVPFEKYIMSALRDAKDRINGPAVADETDALCGRKASTLGRTAST
jgi:hypothetical protein